MFVSPTTAEFARGQAGSFTVETDGFPDAVITVSSGTLPAGLVLTNNGDGTGTISGTPTVAAAASPWSCGPPTPGLRDPDPDHRRQRGSRVTSPATAPFTVGQAATFVVSAPASRRRTWPLTGALPAGLTFVDNGDGTGTISGTPTGSRRGHDGDRHGDQRQRLDAAAAVRRWSRSPRPSPARTRPCSWSAAPAPSPSTRPDTRLPRSPAARCPPGSRSPTTATVPRRSRARRRDAPGRRR